MDEKALKTAIKEIIDGIDKGIIFDAHYVIERLFKEKNRTYLGNISKQEINQYDGTIANIIKGMGYERIGDSISKNVLDNYNTCSCWRKMK
ncbi:MAG: hypothetical protein IKX50_05695 [Spirochaetia bacterium]|nr:hypothetical protein [Spirochaetia bacterium]MBR5017204.1 hypothetical protein [Spirochaetia bacterium]